MILKENNYAFIDSQNLNLAVRDLGWKLDFGRFRKYLADKYGITKAFLFIGYVAGNEALYSRLQDFGYNCVFKPTLELPSGRVKGNVDAELVLHTMIQYPNFDRAVIVTGDGDFYCLVEYLSKQNKLRKVIIPNQYRYSGLLKKLCPPDNNIFNFMNSLKEKLRYAENEKGSRRDGNP
ncbi:MAG: NYN domain-containing protein [Candidatus Liptonbacteria bacterium]|nr:NYN domain-containing protein [Candidatus Liptonbacteria bacterium]